MDILFREQEIVKKYLGIPFKHRGRDLQGFDCYGLILAVYKDLGFELFDIAEDYDEKWSWQGKNHFIENYHKEFEVALEPVIFDMALYKNGRGIINHGGIIINGNRLFHTGKMGTVITKLSSPKLAKRLEGYYHYKKL